MPLRALIGYRGVLGNGDLVTPFTPGRLFLSSDPVHDETRGFLVGLGFRDPDAAIGHLRSLPVGLVPPEAVGILATRLVGALRQAPDPDAALVGFSRYVSACTPDERASLLRPAPEEPDALPLLVEILGTSPFLGEILVRHPEYLDWLAAAMERPLPDRATLEREIDDWVRRSESLSVPDALKRYQRRHLLRIAAGDLLGRESLSVVTAQLSMLADLLVGRVLDAVITERLAREGRATLPGAVAVIGMGKLGGQELNYSSDIDLIYVYEPDDEESQSAHRLFHGLARRLTSTLTEHTAEGYLYRVDLRLRPMGRSGGIAHSLQQLRQYYDTWGVTFERFALLKARPIAGDPDLGRRFESQIEPFVYRQYLDYAALEEIYQHKARVDRAIQKAERERNVKLGRGGIREVELFTQVLQLTFGTREPSLRQRSTLSALEAMRAAGMIAPSVCEELTRAYTFLRTVEHRLQIVQESQTHTLSTDAGDLATCARRLRFAGVAELQAALNVHRDRVHEIYGGLFDRRRGTSDYRARQYFRILGDEVPVNEALVHLAECGFGDPAAALTAIDAFGRYASAASAPASARNVIANLLSVSSRQLVRCARPEVALTRLEQFAAGTGAVVALARSLLENEALCQVLIDVLDHGELPAQRLIRYPELLDSLGRPVPGLADLSLSFETALTAMATLERRQRMDQLRRFKSHEELKVLVGWLGNAELDQLQQRLSLLADYCTSHAARWHAPSAPEDGDRSWAVVALGKLGGTELTVHSDLDLVFVYDDRSDPQDIGLQWQTFVESTQEFLTQPTAEGVAYRIDTRLRPEGTKGPLAIPMAAFRRYLNERAELWERMAWTRARVVVGSPTLSREVLSAAQEFVYGPWEQRFPQYMHHLRLRMERELVKDRSALNLKVGPGGLTDIDFVLQLLQIREGRQRAEFRRPGTRLLLARLPETEYLTAVEVRELREAHRLLRTIETFARMDGDSNVSSIPARIDALYPLGKRIDLAAPAGEHLLELFGGTTDRVRAIYSRVMERLE